MRLLLVLVGMPGILVDIVKQELGKDPDITIRTLTGGGTDLDDADSTDLVVLSGVISPDLQEVIQQCQRKRGAPRVIVLGDGPLSGELYEMRHRGSNISPVELAELVRAVARDAEREMAVTDGNSTLEVTRSRV